MNFILYLCYVEAPPEVFDTRSLYEKLKAQHDVKKKEYEDMWAASKYKKQNFSFILIFSLFLENSIRGLDEDETDFLARIDDARMEKQRQLKRMEQEEIEELKISFFSFDIFYFFH